MDKDIIEEMENTGLVLEGGGMRGMYTTGVLDYFIEKNLYFKNCYGVSAGACQCCSYLSKQKGRAKDVVLEYINDDRYASLKNLLTTGDYFGKDFSLKTIPDELILYDYDTYLNQTSNFYAVATNLETGKAEYLKVEDMKKDMDKIWASSSLPLMSRIVEIDGKKYLDGGVSDSIPVMKSIRDGNRKTVVVLTRDSNYRKSESRLISVIRHRYKEYPKFVRAMELRHIRYNKTLAAINRLAQEGKIFVIAPKEKVEVGRLEKNTGVLEELYWKGYEDAKESYDNLLKYLHN